MAAPTSKIPDNVKLRAIRRLQKLKGDNQKAPDGAAQFNYRGETYTLVRSKNHKHGYKVSLPQDLSAKTARRNKNRPKPKLSEGEQMFLDERYNAAANINNREGRKGLDKIEVDHMYGSKTPHHPAFTQLMEKSENIRKGAAMTDVGFQPYTGPLESVTSSDPPPQTSAPQGDAPDLSQTTAGTSEPVQTGTPPIANQQERSFDLPPTTTSGMQAPQVLDLNRNGVVDLSDFNTAMEYAKKSGGKVVGYAAAGVLGLLELVNALQGFGDPGGPL